MKTSLFKADVILRSAGYRATPGRIKLLTLLHEEHRPLTVTQIHKKIGRTKLNEVTLYRALEALVSSRIVNRVDLQQGNAQYYEFSDTHHHHIICTNCEKVEDFSDALCEEIVVKAVEKSPGFRTISNHSIELFGLCSQCIA